MDIIASYWLGYYSGILMSKRRHQGKQIWPRGGMPNAEFVKLEYDGNKFTLIDMPAWLSPVL